MTTVDDSRHLHTDPLGEAMCGLGIRVEGGPEKERVAGIRGNSDDVWSHGHICPKGVSLGALHDDPDRIRQPLIRVDGRWREVSWDAACRRCTELLTPVIRKYGMSVATAHPALTPTCSPRRHSSTSRPATVPSTASR